MRILVTGGAGYVGSHACKVLAHAGWEPVVFDNLSRGHRWSVKWGPLVSSDLCDRDALRRAIAEHQVQAVMHFAASTYVGESMTQPQQYFRNNFVNSLNLLDGMVEAGVKYLIFSSTCATYGLPETVPIPESHPQQPVNPYGESKRFVERAIHWYGEAYGLRWAALRYFNAAGADPEGDIGELHEPETHLIPLVLEAALDPQRVLSIYGTDYETPDGTAVRDYIHVTDLADAHVKALQYLRRGGSSRAFNLGTGRGYSVREVVAKVEQITGRKVHLKETGRRPGDPPVLIAQNKDAATELNWAPRYSDLDTIVYTAWRWRTEKWPALADSQM